ncbi:MAG: S8 family serine peptidase, partial [Bacteroidota bacterium]
SEAQFWDSLAYLSPNYVIVKASGNNRNETGPAVGTNYWRFNASGAMADAGARPEGISNQDGYDNLPTYSTAKNILTVGNIVAIPKGYAKPSDVVLNSSSSVGPTDDGRIKPDIVANGTSITSTYTGGVNAYATLSGSSMAAPTITGSVVLLHELFLRKTESTAWSSTIRGLVIHSAKRASSNPGPNYMHGWGVPDFGEAGQIIDNTNDNLIQQRTLSNGTKYSVSVIASGKSPLKVSICWNDPPGAVASGTPLNDRTKKLVHDLDVRVIKGSRTYLPWKLEPTIPAFPATKGDNDLDNIEVIELDSTIAGETYTIEVTHKGTLTRAGTQTFSLIATGVGGKTYTSSAASSSSGSKIDSVSIGGLNIANSAGCKTYSDFRQFKASVEAGQTIPFFIKSGSCDASNANRFAKIFIDLNSDGDFNDAGETVATSAAITNNGTFTGTIDIPTSVMVGSML